MDFSSADPVTLLYFSLYNVNGIGYCYLTMQFWLRGTAHPARPGLDPGIHPVRLEYLLHGLIAL